MDGNLSPAIFSQRNVAALSSQSPPFSVSFRHTVVATVLSIGYHPVYLSFIFYLTKNKDRTSGNKNVETHGRVSLRYVRLKGLEPPRREASDPKSDVATNYTTAALRLQR